MSAGALSIECAGACVLLDGERAAVYDGHVLAADVHLDKAVSFQRAGMRVPLGDEKRDLDRLAALAARHAAREIVILGDLVHAPPRPGSATENALFAWQRCHPQLRLSVVVGNHDRDAARSLAHWPVRWLETGYRLGPFALEHTPPAAAAAGGAFVLAGHLHPVMRLRDGRRDALRLPVFWHRGGSLVLPAFGSFTGGHPITPVPGDSVYAVVQGSVMQVC